MKARGRFGRKAASIVGILAMLLGMMIISGCWDLRHLDRLSVVMAMGIDDDPTGKQKMRVTMQTVLAQNAASGNKLAVEGMSVMTFTETGDTVFEAIRKMTRKTSRRLFFSHTRLLIIGEDAARKGVYPLLDLIERNPDIRLNIAVMIARGTSAEKLLQTTTLMDSIPANQIHDTLDINQSAQGQEYLVKVNDITRNAMAGKQQVAVPSLVLEGEQSAGNDEENMKHIHPKVEPKLSTMAILKDGRFVGYLTTKQSRGLSWTQNKVKSTVVKLDCPRSEGNFIVEVYHSKAKMKAEKPKYGESQKPVIHVDLEVKGSIKEIMCTDLGVKEESQLEEAGKLMDAAVGDEVQDAIRRLQKELNSDAMGWGMLVYQEQPSLWKQIGGRWTELFPDVSYVLKVKTDITDSGVRVNSIVK
ncbi:Ger(x)C family spore germination protein [Paenibacillus sp. NEAU-GSW1]|uniref:Ger(x)C family spore germination protein n=1 Tax=Paenibacillus sp. NEAU-GSW1 TaxID=2682486 RepID=UPI0012E2FDB1|nr:Ger(x)C family spore germination protein [Paenibacillus sp. NEAU-GSW1]MUT65073.1 Ger(x)C family spore germination protein [Paenibacillus sp. NEAU-GSW1]